MLIKLYNFNFYNCFFFKSFVNNKPNFFEENDIVSWCKPRTFTESYLWLYGVNKTRKWFEFFENWEWWGKKCNSMTINHSPAVKKTGCWKSYQDGQVIVRVELSVNRVGGHFCFVMKDKSRGVWDMGTGHWWSRGQSVSMTSFSSFNFLLQSIKKVKAKIMLIMIMIMIHPFDLIFSTTGNFTKRYF